MFERRLSWAYYVLCAALAVICIKLFYLQGLQIALEEPEAVLHPPVPWRKIPAHRGAICDRHGLILVGDRPYLDLAVEYEVLEDLANWRKSVESPAEGDSAEVEYEILEDPANWLESVQALTGQPASGLLRTQEEIVEHITGIRQAILRANGRVPRRIYEETIPHTLVAGISLETAARIETNPEQYPGLIVEQNFRRDHPYGTMASQALGILGEAQRPEPGESYDDPNVSPGDLIGLRGIEKQYDRFLRGVPGLYRWKKNRRRPVRVAGDPLLSGGVSAVARERIEEDYKPNRREILFEPEAGRKIILALDYNAQKAAEEALGSQQGGVVVMDVHTGEVLVLASAPLTEELSRATQDRVSPGSVMKPFVAFAAARTPKGGLDKRFRCSGSMTVAGSRRTCSHAHGDMTLEEAIAQSCNVYFWRLALEMGPEPILEMAGDLGLGEKTGIDIPYEWAGHLPDPPDEDDVTSRPWYSLDTMNVTIGQGDVQVTPLQVAVAMAAVANGGKILRPHMVYKIIEEANSICEMDMVTLMVQEMGFPRDTLTLTEYVDYTELTIGPHILRDLAFPPDTLRVIHEGMRGAVEHGTVRMFPELRRLKVAAKTGTAEIWHTDFNHAWLAGFVPYDAPRYAFAAVVHRTESHGAEAASPIVVDVLEALFAGVEEKTAGSGS